MYLVNKIPRFVSNLFPRHFHRCTATASARNDFRKLHPKTVDLAYHSFERVNRSATAKYNTPVIILHGLYGSLRNFRHFGRQLFAALEPWRKIYLLDARNHGESPHTFSHRYDEQVWDLIRFYEQHKIDRAIVLGHSMGGKAAMSLALSHVIL